MSNVKESVEELAVYWDIVLNLRHGCTFIGCHPKSEEQCCICLDDLQECYTITLMCGHTYHRDCLYQAMFEYERKFCPEPTCRKLIMGGRDSVLLGSFLLD